ncbi:MAG: tRNA pseudouridine(38-40) synthase TruA, partial [Patulibacter sp.]|nr:tRNA pseudouridine(38-40) synthase TruA [Patulibacter sp.]
VRVPSDPEKPWLPPPRPAPESGWTTRLLVEYDGTDFVGWAKQPGKRSVEAEFEQALGRILQEVPRIIVGGRTDTGVHARGQVVAYDAEALAPYNLNALLPKDISVLTSEPARPGFDPRNEAISRTYRFRVLHRRERSVRDARWTLHWPRALDLDALHACAAALVGNHDFTAFTPTETLHSWFRRTVDDARWYYEDGAAGDGRPVPADSGRSPILVFEITADSFLRHMNRSLMGTMLDVGLGMRSVESFVALLTGAPRDQAGYTAPPGGLSLESIRYPEA